MRTRTRTDVRSSHLRTYRLDGSRVALVPDQAVLLAGDHVTVEVRVGAGDSLEIVEPGGTVAYAMRGGTARWDVSIELEADASLVWRGEPFVVAEGADVRRGLDVRLAPGARLALRETLVLGRSGEAVGRLRSRTVVRCEVPVLVEELDSATGLGPHRVVDQLLHVALACADHPTTLVLETGDRLHRWIGDATHRSPLPDVRCHSSASPE